MGKNVNNLSEKLEHLHLLATSINLLTQSRQVWFTQGLGDKQHGK